MSEPTNPFSGVIQPTNPFAGLSTEPQQLPAGLTEDQVDRTARMAAVANAPNPLSEQYQELTKMYSDQIRQSGDQTVRLEAATKQQESDLKGLYALTRNAPKFDPTGELVTGSQLAQQAAVAETIQKRSEYALEQTTLNRIKDLASVGDYTQAKVIADNVQKGGAEDIITDINVKKMIIAREVEKAGVAVEDQPWFKHAADFVMTLGGDFLLNNSMDRNNIVDIDKNMKHWWDFAISGNRQRAEAAQLWSMNSADFAKTLRDVVIPRIQDHSTVLGYTNHTEALNLLTGVQDTPAPWKTNAQDAVAVASILPFAKVAKATSIPYMLVRSGARKEAAEALANTGLAAIREGGAEATAKTGITVDEVIDNVVPTAINPVEPLSAVPLTGDTLTAMERGQALLARLPKFLQPGRMSSAELEEAVAKEKVKIAEEIGRPLKDFKTTDVNLSDGSKTTRFEMLIGKKKGGGFATKSTASDWARMQGMEGSEIVLDDSGQYFIKHTRDLNEAGYMTNNLDPLLKNTGLAGRLVLGARHLGDVFLQTLDRSSANTRNRMIKHLHDTYAQHFDGMNTLDKDRLGQILAWGENKGTWLTRSETEELWARSGAKKPPPTKIHEAYQAMRDINDIEFALRNDVQYKGLVTKGFETGTFSHPLFDAPVERENILIQRTSGLTPKTRVFDMESGIHYTKDNPLTPERLRTMHEDGYVLVSLEKEKALKDGTTVKTFLMKKNQLKAETLRRDQLAYRAGGHRMYADNYFAKQAVSGVQADTGEAFLKNPATYMSGTQAEVHTWASTMEHARQLYKAKASAATLDEVLSPLGYMDGETFIQHMENGVFQKDHSFEAMFDRELPTVYAEQGLASDFVDLEETGFSGWLRTNGRMYYSSKGEQILDWKGNLARTIDPFETANAALANVANLSSFSDYKISAVERWVKTYGKFLNTDGLPPGASALTKFSQAKYSTKADTLPMKAGEKIKQQMEAQRDIIKRNLGWRTETDRRMENLTENIGNFVLGGDPESVRHTVGKALGDWWDNKNPLNAMRGLAFDLKMGLLNVAQFPLQIQTIVSSLALGGEHAQGALLNLLPMRAYLTKSGGEQYLNQLVKQGLHKASGLTPKDYKDMLRAGKESGFFEFGGAHQLINSHGPNAVAGGFSDGWDKFTRAGRFFFNEGETWNRTVAWQVAWKEQMAKKAFPVGSRDFLNHVSLRADDFSMSMMSESAAMWQKGLTSIPTQFWAYQARMMEAFLGDTFTGAQKARLAIAQTFFYGAAGLPFVKVVTDLKNGATGKAPELNTIEGMIDRGFLDHLIYNLSGADVMMGQRYGTGTFMADTIGTMFGMSPYGEKSAADVLGGATYSIMGQSLSVLKDVIKHVVAESGAEDYPLAKEDLMRLAQQVSTLSYGMRAMMVMNYGTLMSSKGTVVATDLPTQDAFYMALGLQPGVQDDISAAFAWKKKQSTAVDEAAKFINNHRTRMSVEVDRRDEIAAEINAYVRLLPPDIRIKALKKAHNQTPKDLYHGLKDQMDKDLAEQEMIKKYGQTN